VQVAVYRANDDVRLEEWPRPRPAAGELLLRVEASGNCGSDVLEWYRKPRAPLVQGHEVAGVVEEIGEGELGFKVGDRVVTTHHVPCNDCVFCRSDRHSVCETLHNTTFDPGGFAQWVRVPAINVRHGTFRLPDTVSFEDASFVEPLACVIRGQRLAGVREGDTVAVLGAGISGALQLLWARHLGCARIVATDVHPYRLEVAGRCGADAGYNATDAELVERMRADNGGNGFDRVLVCNGSPISAAQALQLVGDGGCVLFFASPKPGETLELPVNELWRRCVTIVHSYAGPPAEMKLALAAIAAGDVAVTPLITHRLGLDQIQRGFELTAAAGESLKVIVHPHGS
jgi:L-iditol 2-dehydrogenase